MWFIVNVNLVNVRDLVTMKCKYFDLFQSLWFVLIICNKEKTSQQCLNKGGYFHLFLYIYSTEEF